MVGTDSYTGTVDCRCVQIPTSTKAWGRKDWREYNRTFMGFTTTSSSTSTGTMTIETVKEAINLIETEEQAMRKMEKDSQGKVENNLKKIKIAIKKRNLSTTRIKNFQKLNRDNFIVLLHMFFDNILKQNNNTEKFNALLEDYSDLKKRFEELEKDYSLYGCYYEANVDQWFNFNEEDIEEEHNGEFKIYGKWVKPEAIYYFNSCEENKAKIVAKLEKKAKKEGNNA